MGTPLSEALAAGDREAFAALYDRLGLDRMAAGRFSTPPVEPPDDILAQAVAAGGRDRGAFDHRAFESLAADDCLPHSDMQPVRAATPPAHPGMLRVLDGHLFLEETL